MSWPYQVCIDRACLLTGSHSAGTTTWTVPFKDTTMDSVILGPDFGALAGTIVTVTGANISGSTTLVTASGNYSAGVAAVGRSYLSRMRLATPKVKDGRGFTVNGVKLWLRELVPVFQDLGSITFRRSLADVTDTEQTIENPGVGLYSSGESRILLNGPFADMSIYVESDDPRPFVLTSMEYLVQATNRDN